ncbi:MAG TPA: SRPBCC domain-containing protein [Chitinophagales bacterium]|nr:SRPBCC domain-containing protein [Chitinophagales bacterium]
MEDHLFIRKEIILDAPVSKVWDSLTKPKYTRQYMYECDAISDWKKGSELIWKGHHDSKVYVKGHIVDIDPEKLLRFTTFGTDSKLPDIPANYSTVTYTLTPEDGKTKLIITDGDFAKIADGQARYKDSMGGWDMVLPKLKEAVEKESKTA